MSLRLLSAIAAVVLAGNQPPACGPLNCWQAPWDNVRRLLRSGLLSYSTGQALWNKLHRLVRRSVLSYSTGQAVGTVGPRVQRLVDKRGESINTTVPAFDLMLEEETAGAEEANLTSPCLARGELAEPLVLWHSSCSRTSTGHQDKGYGTVPRDKGRCLDQLTPGCVVYIEGELQIDIDVSQRPAAHWHYDPRVRVVTVFPLRQGLALDGDGGDD